MSVLSWIERGPALLRLGIAWTLLAAGGCGGSKASEADTSAIEAACGGLYDVLWGASCQPGIPAAELSRQRDRYVAQCTSQRTLPGEGTSAAQMQACAAALRTSGAGCFAGVLGATLLGDTVLGEPHECMAGEGSLGAGAACFADEECQSGQCNVAPMVDGGVPTCGRCVPEIAAGHPCDQNTRFNCEQPGSVCVLTGTAGICQPISYGGAGAACDAIAAFCDDGLHCDAKTAVCTAAKPEGAPCSSYDECAAPLRCTTPTGSPTGTCAMPGGVGAQCTAALDCAPGLGCSPTNQCAAITYAARGQPCGGLVQCLIGICLVASDGTGICPTVIPDGQPCNAFAATDPPTTCDSSASCINGVCTLSDPVCH